MTDTSQLAEPISHTPRCNPQAISPGYGRQSIPRHPAAIDRLSQSARVV